MIDKYLDIPMFVTVFIDSESDEGNAVATEIQRVPGGLMLNGFYVPRKDIEYDSFRVDEDKKVASIISPPVRGC